jgi:glutamyl-tRNA synthetase
MDKDGSSLSKRLGSLGMKQLRDEGIDPMAICSLLARLGTSQPIHAFLSMNELAEQFDLSTFSRNAPRFNIDELREMNHKLMTHMPFSSIHPKLKAMGYGDFSEKEWDLFKGNIESVADYTLWHDIFHGAIEVPVDLDRDYIKEAASLLPEMMTETSWQEWTTAVKEKTGRKGKDLFMPLRQALTGQDHGPEMREVLPLLGYEKAKTRLLKAAD